MGAPARKRATYADVLAVPAHLVAEIIDGELVTSPRPAPRHARAASALGATLWGPFDGGIGGPGGWWILVEPELHLLGRREPLVPDVAGWRVERMPTLPDSAFFETSPDWIAEILSPRTAAIDRADKLPIYGAAGVGHAWLVDPLIETIEIFRLDRERWVLVKTLKGPVRVRAEPFDAVEIDLAPLWKRSALSGPPG